MVEVPTITKACGKAMLTVEFEVAGGVIEPSQWLVARRDVEPYMAMGQVNEMHSGPVKPANGKEANRQMARGAVETLLSHQ